MFRPTISWKLLAASAVVGAAATGIAVNGLRRIHTLNERLVRLVDYSSEKVKLAAMLKQDVIAATRAERNLILSPNDEAMKRHASAIDETLTAMQEHLQQLLNLVDNDDQAQLDAFATRWQEWQRIHRQVRKIAQLNSDSKARELTLGKGQDACQRFETALNRIAENTITAKPTSTNTPTYTAENSANASLLTREMQTLNTVASLLTYATKLQRAEKHMILAPNQTELEQDAQQFGPLIERINSGLTELRNVASDVDKPLVAEAASAFQAYTEILSETQSVLGQSGSFFVYQFAFEKGAPLVAECERTLDEIITRNERDLQMSRAEGRGAYVTARNTLLAVSTAGIVISVAVTYFTGRHIARNLAQLADYTRDMRNSGDLSKPIPKISQDEVGLLAESFDHLRRSLFRQTSELAALNQALEQKSREMEQFVYTISHDLSSPLVSCKGLVGLIKEDIAAENFPEVLASSKKLDMSVEQLRRIIEDLLTLSRIGRKPLHITEVNVESLIADLREELSDRVQRARATLRVESPLPNVTADATDLKRIFENLLSNAIKYGCNGDSATITVGGSKSADETRFFVSDSGPGIQPQFHEQIFGLFQRLDTGQPGTGVGLASVAKIMRMHGGRAWVESEPGKGATFWIAFGKNSPQQ